MGKHASSLNRKEYKILLGKNNCLKLIIDGTAVHICLFSRSSPETCKASIKKNVRLSPKITEIKFVYDEAQLGVLA